MYKLIGTKSVKRLADGAYIPFADGNRDYEEYKQWLVEGNTPEPEFTEEELAKHEQAILKAEKEEALRTLTVTTTNGNTFDGNETARNNILSAITSAEFIGKTEEYWKLADNSTVLVQLPELKEALALAIQEVGNIVKDY